ncbi:hypothetical protein HUU62_04290 [Rhodoferax sp. 4810]|nr:hypothetical protein [Rhodoferax jenense]
MNAPKIKSELRSRITIEGQAFEVTKGTDDLSETPNRLGLFAVSEHGSSVKFYFDDLESLRKLGLFLVGVDAVLEHLEGVSS